MGSDMPMGLCEPDFSSISLASSEGPEGCPSVERLSDRVGMLTSRHCLHHFLNPELRQMCIK